MNDSAKTQLENVFRTVFELPSHTNVRDIRQMNLRRWDSLGHVLLMAAIENEFNLQIELADQLSLTSFDALELYLSERGV